MFGLREEFQSTFSICGGGGGGQINLFVAHPEGTMTANET